MERVSFLAPVLLAEKELLSELIDDFQVIPSDAEEIAFHPDGP